MMIGRAGRFTVRETLANIMRNDLSRLERIAALPSTHGLQADLLESAIIELRGTMTTAAVMAASEPAADPARMRADLARLGPAKALEAVERYVERNLATMFFPSDLPEGLTHADAARRLVEAGARMSGVTSAGDIEDVTRGCLSLSEQARIVLREAFGLPGENWAGNEDRVAVIDACQDMALALRGEIEAREERDAAPPGDAPGP